MGGRVLIIPRCLKYKCPGRERGNVVGAHLFQPSPGPGAGQGREDTVQGGTKTGEEGPGPAAQASLEVKVAEWHQHRRAALKGQVPILQQGAQRPMPASLHPRGIRSLHQGTLEANQGWGVCTSRFSAAPIPKCSTGGGNWQRIPLVAWGQPAGEQRPFYLPLLVPVGCG